LTSCEFPLLDGLFVFCLSIPKLHKLEFYLTLVSAKKQFALGEIEVVFKCKSVWAACLLLDYPEWGERGTGIDRGDYVTCLPRLVCLPLVLKP
jgi:hypothetical protein